jgi:hypothetical protein
MACHGAEQIFAAQRAADGEFVYDPKDERHWRDLAKHLVPLRHAGIVGKCYA